MSSPVWRWWKERVRVSPSALAFCSASLAPNMKSPADAQARAGAPESQRQNARSTASVSHSIVP